MCVWLDQLGAIFQLEEIFCNDSSIKKWYVEEISDQNDDDTCRLSHGQKKKENMDLDQQGYVIQYRELNPLQ
jgi:hypothetical protein